jgi:hypothetical protein
MITTDAMLELAEELDVPHSHQLRESISLL